MDYIANIVTNNKINSCQFFNVTNDYESIDKSIPTLIIGWSNVKQLFPEQDILNYNINDKISWTFSKREKRYKYENDLISFNKKVVDYINDKIKYRFFNFILSNEQKRNSFISYVKHGDCSLYFNSRFLYVYNNNDSIIIGISLKDLKYIGIDIKKFISNLIEGTNNIICNNINFLTEESLFLIKDNIKIVAFLNYLKNRNIYK